MACFVHRGDRAVTVQQGDRGHKSDGDRRSGLFKELQHQILIKFPESVALKSGLSKSPRPSDAAAAKDLRSRRRLEVDRLGKAWMTVDIDRMPHEQYLQVSRVDRRNLG
jgi:hypothetical protein